MKKSLPEIQKNACSFFLVGIMTLFISLPAFSATYYSRQSGNWNDVNSWSLIGFGGAAAAALPGAGDDVIIDRSYIKITLANVNVLSVLISNTQAVGGTSAKLLISDGRKLSVTNNFNVTAENIAKDNTLKLEDNATELEVFGNLIFTRTANNVQNNRNNYILDDASKVTVHGNYVVNNLNGPLNMIQNDISLNDNAMFICEGDVTWNIHDLCKHWCFIKDNSAWQIDGDFNLLQNGTGEVRLLFLQSSSITINQDLNVSFTNSGKCTFLASGGYSGTPGSVFHVLGDVDVNHPTGGDFGMETTKTGEFRIDGDLDISWPDAWPSGLCYFSIWGSGELNVAKSLIVNMNGIRSTLSVSITGNSEMNIGNNNGLLQESATINMVNSWWFGMNLETNGEFNVFGDFNQSINAYDDIKIELNKGVNNYTGRSQINVAGNWNIIKDEGDAFLIKLLKGSDVLVAGNFNYTSTNHEAWNFEDEEIIIQDISKFEVGGTFNYNIDDANQNINLRVDLADDAIMKTGSNSGHGTSLTLNDGNAISVSLVDNAVWETSGDFNIKCIDGASSSTVDLTNSSVLIVGKDLVLNNTQNNNNIAVHSELTSLIDVNGDIDMTNLSAQNLGLITVSDDSKLELEGSLVHNVAPNNYGSLIVENNGVIEFNGMDAQIIPPNTGAGTDVTELGNVVLNSFSINVPQFTVPEDASMKSLTLNNLNEIEISSDASLTVSNGITNNGTVYVENNASLVQTNAGANTNAGNGTYQVKRTGKNVATVYNVWSSPIESASLVSAFNGTNACDMYVFEPSVQNWNYDFAAGYSTTCGGNAVTFQAGNVIAGGDGVMDVARGYYVPGSANATRTFNGEVNNGDINIPIETTALGNNANWTDDDWNLVGNPYPSSLDATAFWTVNAVNNARITNGIYYWDDADPNAAANQNSDYAYWNMAGGVSSGNSNKIPNGHIASGQGFWVYANANTNLVFNNSMRSTTNDQFFKQENVTRNQNVWISLSTPSQKENNILVGFNPNATDTVDDLFDAHKLEVNPHVYFASRVDSQNFVIQSLASLSVGDSKVVPLTLKSDEHGIHNISAYKKENLSDNIVIYVHDKFQGTMHDLSQGDYAIGLNPNQEYTARFELVFKFELEENNGGVTSKDLPSDSTMIAAVEDLEHNGFSTISTSDRLQILNEDGSQGTIQIFDLTGKQIFEKTLGNETSISVTNWSSLASGTYIITVVDKNTSLFSQQIMKK